MAKTQEPSVAYIYKAGLKGFPIKDDTTLAWRDTAQHWQEDAFRRRAEYRAGELAGAQPAGDSGCGSRSLAVFPPPHKFFFARENEVNLGFVYYRKDDDHSFSLGIMWPERGEGYHPWGATDAEWKRRVGVSRGRMGQLCPVQRAGRTLQRMAVYYYLSTKSAVPTQEAVLAYTHDDVFKPLPGFKLAGHFHLDFNETAPRPRHSGLSADRGLASSALWESILFTWAISTTIPIPKIPGQKRFKEEKVYFEGAQRVSDKRLLGHAGGRAERVLRRPLVDHDAEAGLLFPRRTAGRRASSSWRTTRPMVRSTTSVRPKTS